MTTPFVKQQQKTRKQFERRGQVVWHGSNGTAKSVGIKKHTTKYVPFKGNHEPSPTKEALPQYSRGYRRGMRNKRYGEKLFDECVAMRDLLFERTGVKVRMPKVKGKYLTGVKSKLQKLLEDTDEQHNN